MTGEGPDAAAVVVLRGQGPRLAAALEELEPALTGIARLEVVSDAWPATPFAVGVALPGADTAVDWVHGARHGWRGILVTDAPTHDDLDVALDLGVLRSVIRAPWTPGSLAAQVRAQLSRHVRATDPAHPALARLDRGERWLELPDAPLLRDLEEDAATVTTRLVRAVDRALGPRPRLHLEPGIRLTRQGVGVDAVLIVLDGAVGLDRRAGERAGTEFRLHHDSTGPVVGLLALTQQQQAFFTARTTTAVTAIHLSIEQLDLALAREPEVTAALAALTVQALALRLRRSDQLQLDKDRLNRELDEERHRLEQTLRQLEDARLELVESARMATLGELSAGIAHELNNPVAALRRAIDHVGDDLGALLADHPEASELQHTLRAVRDAPPRTTATDRDRRRALEARGLAAEAARRLVAAGIEPETIEASTLDDAHGLARLEAAGRLATALRDATLASRRIAELVDAVRAHARPTQAPVTGVEVEGSIDDAVRLLAHRLQGVTLERDVGSLVTVRAHPAQLGQVWTNLITNAVEAPATTIRIMTTMPDADHVRVVVADDGPGIPAHELARVFEPRFTTKQGRVRYGLGQGLAIARRIVDHHGGTITITSQPGDTRVAVTLPVGGPPDPQETQR